nr:hypothetical protein OA9_23660 [Vibrio cyclitrophicus 1F97]
MSCGNSFDIMKVSLLLAQKTTALKSAMSKKDESSGGRNLRGAKKGHTGHQRKLSPLKDKDIIIDGFPDSCLCCAQSDIYVHGTYRARS